MKPRRALDNAAVAAAASKVAVARVPRERYRIPNVFESGAYHDQSLKAEAEPSVGDGAKAPEVEVPLQRVFANAHLSHALLQMLDTLFSLASSNDLADTRQQHIHRRYSLPAGLTSLVLTHVKALDFLGVIDDDHRALVNLVREIALVLAGEVCAPAFRFQNPLFLGLANNINSFGVSQHGELLVHDFAQARDKALVLLVKESDVFGATIYGLLHAKLDEIDSVADVVVDVGECELGLNHPELGEVLVRVRVLSPESRTKGVHGGQGAGIAGAKREAEMQAREDRREERLTLPPPVAPKR
jgi:hypothetical protein